MNKPAAPPSDGGSASQRRVTSGVHIVELLAEAEPAGEAELHNKVGVSLRCEAAGLVTVTASIMGQGVP